MTDTIDGASTFAAGSPPYHAAGPSPSAAAAPATVVVFTDVSTLVPTAAASHASGSSGIDIETMAPFSIVGHTHAATPSSLRLGGRRLDEHTLPGAVLMLTHTTAVANTSCLLVGNAENHPREELPVESAELSVMSPDSDLEAVSRRSPASSTASSPTGQDGDAEATAATTAVESPGDGISPGSPSISPTESTAATTVAGVSGVAAGTSPPPATTASPHNPTTHAAEGSPENHTYHDNSNNPLPVQRHHHHRQHQQQSPQASGHRGDETRQHTVPVSHSQMALVVSLEGPSGLVVSPSAAVGGHAAAHLFDGTSVTAPAMVANNNAENSAAAAAAVVATVVEHVAHDPALQRQLQEMGNMDVTSLPDVVAEAAAAAVVEATGASMTHPSATGAGVAAGLFAKPHAVSSAAEASRDGGAGFPRLTVTAVPVAALTQSVVTAATAPVSAAMAEEITHPSSHRRGTYAESCGESGGGPTTALGTHGHLHAPEMTPSPHVALSVGRVATLETAVLETAMEVFHSAPTVRHDVGTGTHTPRSRRTYAEEDIKSLSFSRVSGPWQPQEGSLTAVLMPNAVHVLRDAASHTPLTSIPARGLADSLTSFTSVSSSQMLVQTLNYGLALGHRSAGDVTSTGSTSVIPNTYHGSVGANGSPRKHRPITPAIASGTPTTAAAEAGATAEVGGTALSAEAVCSSLAASNHSRRAASTAVAYVRGSTLSEAATRDVGSTHRLCDASHVHTDTGSPETVSASPFYWAERGSSLSSVSHAGRPGGECVSSSSDVLRGAGADLRQFLETSPHRDEPLSVQRWAAKSACVVPSQAAAEEQPRTPLGTHDEAPLSFPTDRSRRRRADDKAAFFTSSDTYPSTTASLSSMRLFAASAGSEGLPGRPWSLPRARRRATSAQGAHRHAANHVTCQPRRHRPAEAGASASPSLEEGSGEVLSLPRFDVSSAATDYSSSWRPRRQPASSASAPDGSAPLLVPQQRSPRLTHTGNGTGAHIGLTPHDRATARQAGPVVGESLVNVSDFADSAVREWLRSPQLALSAQPPAALRLHGTVAATTADVGEAVGRPTPHRNQSSDDSHHHNHNAYSPRQPARFASGVGSPPTRTHVLSGSEASSVTPPTTDRLDGSWNAAAHPPSGDGGRGRQTALDFFADQPHAAPHAHQSHACSLSSSYRSSEMASGVIATAVPSPAMLTLVTCHSASSSSDIHHAQSRTAIGAHDNSAHSPTSPTNPTNSSRSASTLPGDHTPRPEGPPRTRSCTPPCAGPSGFAARLSTTFLFSATSLALGAAGAEEQSSAAAFSDSQSTRWSRRRRYTSSSSCHARAPHRRRHELLTVKRRTRPTPQRLASHLVRVGECELIAMPSPTTARGTVEAEGFLARLPSHTEAVPFCCAATRCTWYRSRRSESTVRRDVQRLSPQWGFTPPRQAAADAAALSAPSLQSSFLMSATGAISPATQNSPPPMAQWLHDQHATTSGEEVATSFVDTPSAFLRRCGLRSRTSMDATELTSASRLDVSTTGPVAHARGTRLTASQVHPFTARSCTPRRRTGRSQRDWLSVLCATDARSLMATTASTSAPEMFSLSFLDTGRGCPTLVPLPPVAQPTQCFAQRSPSEVQRRAPDPRVPTVRTHDVGLITLEDARVLSPTRVRSSSRSRVPSTITTFAVSDAAVWET